MTTRHPEYHNFLQNAQERKTVSCILRPGPGPPNPFLKEAPCETSFRAIENNMLFSKACDVTGIVAIACARHGCFAPNSIVDLFRGEQQKNVDWSLLEAIRTTGVHPDQGLMLIMTSSANTIYTCSAESVISFHLGW